MENCYIEDWLAARTESSKTKRSYMGNVEIFQEFAKQRGRDFQGVVTAWRRVKRAGMNEREDFLEAWSDTVRSFNTHIKKKYAPLTVKNLLATIKSFLGFWEIPVKVCLPRRACVIYHNKDLTREELRQVLSFASPRDRVIWLVMAESGMRGSTVVNLKYWQIKKDFEAERTPLNVKLPSSSLKDHVGDRWTFIGEDAFRELKEYLAQRLPLDDEEFVFTSEKPGRVRGGQFSVASLSVKFSRVVQKLGLTKTRMGKPKRIRMHNLRKFFRNNMKTDSAYLKFWMGHSLGVDAHYISRSVETHRREYAKGYRFLRVFEPSLESLADLTERLRSRDQQIQKQAEQNKALKERLENVQNEIQGDMAQLSRELRELTARVNSLFQALQETTKYLTERERAEYEKSAEYKKLVHSRKSSTADVSQK